MTTVYLVRHGETLWNREGRIQGWRDSPLSEAGRAQARWVAERLAREPLDALVASDLRRALDTAAAIADATGLEVSVEPGLRERSYGIVEAKTWAEIARDEPEIHRRLAQRDMAFPVPGGESVVEFRDRVVAALEALVARFAGRRVAVVTHGGVLGVIYRHATSTPLDAPRTFAIPNAGLSRLRRAGSDWVVEAWGETEHLSVEALDDE